MSLPRRQLPGDRTMTRWTLLLFLTVAGCTTTTETPCSVPPPSVPEVQCPFGQPIYHCDTGPCIAPVVVQRSQHWLGYSPTRNVPLWVCETIEPHELTGEAERKSSFPLDPLIPAHYQGASSLYVGSGLHRGHLAAAANQKWNQTAMNDTFYMSNVAPQYPKFNRAGGVWYRLEEWVRDLAFRYSDKVYVISGPMFYYWRAPISSGDFLQEVQVPSHYFKVVVAKRGTKNWQAVAFTVENKDEAFSADLSTTLNAIDNIEQATGLDLLPALSTSREEALERKPPTWSLWSN